ncbi:uncharacterized protein LOC143466199 [Clavelina lepadiformis]|uniref:uncharacterized protein LOC143466199 n=1 Tax=Clavelina lepadiformis TaxID=159417 RepID=UPI0040436F27
MSPWSPWTNCSAQCGPDGISTRTREILQTSKCVGTSCPTDLIQNRPCNRECYNDDILMSSQCSCNEDVDECANELYDCDRNAACVNIMGSFECSCKSGFIEIGMKCVGSFECVCTEGYTGDLTQCSNIDECATANDNCEKTNGDLHVRQLARRNYKHQRLRGKAETQDTSNEHKTRNIRTDVDECLQESDVCDPNAYCVNLPGSFICFCTIGFTGDGSQCTNRCANCDPQLARCVDIGENFLCECLKGDIGTEVVCEDIDECQENEHNCDLNALCVNVAGSFFCSCLEGYTGNGTHCSDIDKCSSGVHNCDLEKAICSDTDGSYVCECFPGYVGDGTACRALNLYSTPFIDCHVNASCFRRC